MNMRVRIPRANRIGVDLDTKNRFRLLKAYFNALRFGDVYVFETEHGYHIKIYPKRNYSMEERMNIRRMLGDDPDRLAWDELKIRMGCHRFVDTLFEAKRVNCRVVSREELINPMSEARRP